MASPVFLAELVQRDLTEERVKLAIPDRKDRREMQATLVETESVDPQ